jgi:SulP family sulfate permease
VGCIGGVGVFLIITGFNVSTRLQDDDISLSLNTLLFFLRGHNLVLWVPAFALAVLLRVITYRWNHQLMLPTCAHSPALSKRILTGFFFVRGRTDFLIIPVLFYFVVFVAGLDLDSLRRDGWLFEVAEQEKWYRFYTYFGEFYLGPKISSIDHA